MAAIGVLTSVPFVPPTDAYRVRLYAASIMVFGMLPAMGVALIVGRLKLKILSPINPEIQENNITAVFSAMLILMILSGPLIVKATNQQTPPFEFSCPADSDRILIQFDPGTSINIMREKDLFLDWMPNFHQGLFSRNAHDLADNNLIHYFETIRPGTSIVSTLDLISNEAALITIQTYLLPQPGTYLGVCGHWAAEPGLKKYNVFFADEAAPFGR
jgi:hypothetical protein